MGLVDRLLEGLDWATITGGSSARRLEAARRVITENLEVGCCFRLAQCCDEKTGSRYGRAKCRLGRSAKIGSGGRNRGNKGYQIWMVWTLQAHCRLVDNGSGGVEVKKYATLADAETADKQI